MESSRETPTGRSVRPAGQPASARVARFLRRRQRSASIDSLMADLARIEAADSRPEGRIDPAERAVLIGLYRELIGTIDGRVVPFPVELMDDPSLTPDRIRPGEVVDLAAARALRAVPPGEAVPDGLPRAGDHPLRPATATGDPDAEPDGD